MERKRQREAVDNSSEDEDTADEICRFGPFCHCRSQELLKVQRSKRCCRRTPIPSSDEDDITEETDAEHRRCRHANNNVTSTSSRNATWTMAEGDMNRLTEQIPRQLVPCDRAQPMPQPVIQPMPRALLHQPMARPMPRALLHQPMAQPMPRALLHQPMARPMPRPMPRAILQPMARPMARPLARAPLRRMAQPMAQPMPRAILQPMPRAKLQPMPRPMARPLARAPLRRMAQPMPRAILQVEPQPMPRPMPRALLHDTPQVKPQVKPLPKRKDNKPWYKITWHDVFFAVLSVIILILFLETHIETFITGRPPYRFSCYLCGLILCCIAWCLMMKQDDDFDEDLGGERN